MDKDNITNSINIDPTSAGQLSKKPEDIKDLAKMEDTKILYKKTEKIVTAIYIVTNFLPENDSLRDSLRSHSLNLLSLMGSITFHDHGDLKKIISEIRSCSIQIISMLGVAFYAGYISEMNHQIIVKELETYKHENSIFNTTLENSFTLGNSYMSVSNERIVSENSKDKYKGQKALASKAGTGNANKIIRNSAQSGTVFIKKQGRREAIISVLEKKGNVTIKDISDTVSECSEKTIQRELISLVKSGVLKKSGERRWSTYSLA